MPRALGGDHQHVEVRARLDQLEVDVEAVREQEGRTLLHVRAELVAVEVGLQLVRHQHHDHVGPFRGLGRRQALDAGGLDLLARRGAGLERDRHLGHAAVLEVVGVAEALAAIADDGDLLAFDQIQVGVGIVVDAHGAQIPLDCRGVIQLCGGSGSRCASPRPIATTPARLTSTGSSRSMKASSSSEVPVTSNTNCQACCRPAAHA